MAAEKPGFSGRRWRHFFSTRLTGTLSSLLSNALPIWRQRACAQGLADLRERMSREQCIYIVFPEGTRTRTGNINPFHAGLGMLVAGSGVPVIPCFISGSFRALPRSRRTPLPVKLRLTIGEPMVFADSPNDRDGWDGVARRVEAVVIAMGANAG